MAIYRSILRAWRFACALALAFSLSACSGGMANVSANAQNVTVGIDNTAVNTLILIAQEQDFFGANGIRLNIKSYASGLAAVNDMLDHGAVDIATASEFVVVGRALAGDKIRAIGSIDEFMHNYIIARKDRGIQSIADLRGKTIGVTFKTAAEFYLGRFLELHNLSLENVKLVDTGPADLVNALAGGKVDAVAAWQPNAKTLEDRLGSGAVRWPSQSDQSSYAVLVSTPAWIEKHPDTAKRFLNALAQADAWYASHPEETKSILKKRLSYNDSYLSTIWPEHQFQLSFDQAMILAMEDEARWEIRRQWTSTKETPVFLDYLYLDGMQAVRPDAVNIIR